MTLRGMAAKVAVVAIMAGTGVAIAAPPASAMRNDRLCSLAWRLVAHSQALMEGATTQADFDFYFQEWVAATNDVSSFC